MPTLKFSPADFALTSVLFWGRFPLLVYSGRDLIGSTRMYYSPDSPSNLTESKLTTDLHLSPCSILLLLYSSFQYVKLRVLVRRPFIYLIHPVFYILYFFKPHDINMNGWLLTVTCLILFLDFFSLSLL